MVKFVVKAPEPTNPTPPHDPPPSSPPSPTTPSALPPLKVQPVRGSGYCCHAHFSIMSSSACRKRKPLVQPETLEHSTRDSSLSSALHFLNEIPLPLASTAAQWEEGSCCSETHFFSYFAKCQRVERRSFWPMGGSPHTVEMLSDWTFCFLGRQKGVFV